MSAAAAIRTLLLATLLTACSTERADSGPQDSDPGLIVNPLFELSESGKRPAKWGFSQHAGEPSYEMAATDGVLTIRRIGEEPWALVNQRLDVTKFAGRELSFSMELAGELDESHGPALRPSGLVVRILGYGPGGSPLLGKGHLLVLDEVPGLSAGTHSWSRHELRFRVPEGRGLDLSVGVLMTMGGELRARAPRLVVIDEPAAQ